MGKPLVAKGRRRRFSYGKQVLHSHLICPLEHLLIDFPIPYNVKNLLPRLGHRFEHIRFIVIVPIHGVFPARSQYR